jgi:hypothetical protein
VGRGGGGGAVPGPGATRQAVTTAQPRLPLACDEAWVPAPPGWDGRLCGCLLFGPPEDELAGAARARGGIVQQLAGRQLHQLVDPDGVARSLPAITDQPAITKP